MALKWIEGFELYEGGGAPPDHFAYKYTNVNQTYGLSTTTGRFFGYALRLGKDTGGSPDSFRTPQLDGQTTWVVGMNIARAVAGVDGTFFEVYGGGDLQLQFRIVDDDIQVYRNGSTLIHTFTSILADESDTRWYHLQIKVTIDTSGGSVGIKVDNGTEVSQGSLNTDFNASSEADAFGWSGHSGASNSYSWYIDDIYICDSTGSDNNDYLGALVVEGIRPNANGHHEDWAPSTGTNWQNVDDNDEANYNSASALNEFGKIDTYEFEDLSAIDSNIKGVQVNGFFINTGTANPVMKFKSRVNSVDYETDTFEVANTEDYDHFSEIFEDNPNTSADWAKSELEAAEFGVELTPLWIS